MSAADIVLIFIGILSLMVSFGSLVVAFLTFLDKRNSKKYNRLQASPANLLS